MNRTVVGIAAGAVVLIAVAFAVSMSGGGEPALNGDTQLTAEVLRGPLRVTVLAKGQIVAKKTERIRHDVDKQLKIAEVVDEGTRVEAGQVVVRLDTAQLEEDLRNCEAELTNALIAEEIATKELEILQRENENALSRAAVKLRESEQELDKYVNGDLPRTEQGMELKIEEAASQLSRRRESYEAIKAPELIAGGFVTPLQIEEERIALRSAEINLELARSELELFRKYTRPTSLASKRVAVDTAREELQKTKTVGENRLIQKRAELSQRQETVRQKQARADQLRRDIASCVLRAPRAGLVMHGERRSSWQSPTEINVGDTVQRRQVIVTVPELENLIVRAQVSEGEVMKIAEGMVAAVTSDAYPELKLTGTLSKIGTMPIRQWYSSTQSFEIEIDLPPTTGEMRPNVSAEAQILAQELTDVLQVPVTAVFTHEAYTFAYVTNSTVEARLVELGSATDTRVQILSGLKEGEKILLYEPEDVELPKLPKKEPAASAQRARPAQPHVAPGVPTVRSAPVDGVTVPRPADSPGERRPGAGDGTGRGEGGRRGGMGGAERNGAPR